MIAFRGIGEIFLARNGRNSKEAELELELCFIVNRIILKLTCVGLMQDLFIEFIIWHVIGVN